MARDPEHVEPAKEILRVLRAKEHWEALKLRNYTLMIDVFDWAATEAGHGVYNHISKQLSKQFLQPKESKK